MVDGDENAKDDVNYNEVTKIIKSLFLINYLFLNKNLKFLFLYYQI